MESNTEQTNLIIENETSEQNQMVEIHVMDTEVKQENQDNKPTDLPSTTATQTTNSKKRKVRKLKVVVSPQSLGEDGANLCLVIVSFGFFVWGFIGLITSDGAKADASCGNIYENVALSITGRGLIILCEFIKTRDKKFHKYLLPLVFIIGALIFSEIIWSFYVWGSKFDSGCKSLYNEYYYTLSLYYIVNFWIFIIVLAVFASVLFFYSLAKLVEPFVNYCVSKCV